MLADRDRRVGVDGQPPDRRAQPVGPDDQVVAVLAAVVEGHLDRPVDPLEGPDPGAQAHRHPLAQDGVQVGPVQGQARADPPPEAGQVHVDQHPPAPVEDPLAADLDPPVGHGLLQAEGPQGPGPVGGQVDAGPVLPGRRPVDHLRVAPGLAERPGQGQAGKAGPDDQDPELLHVHQPWQLIDMCTCAGYLPFTKAAQALAVFFTNPTSEVEFSKIVAVYPSTLAAYDDPFFSEEPELIEDSARPLAEDIISKQKNIMPSIPKKADVNAIVAKAVESAVFNNVPAQQALTDAVTQANALLP